MSLASRNARRRGRAGAILRRLFPRVHNRRARYYSLTAPSLRYLLQEEANWKRLSAAIGLVL